MVWMLPKWVSLSRFPRCKIKSSCTTTWEMRVWATFGCAGFAHFPEPLLPITGPGKAPFPPLSASSNRRAPPCHPCDQNISGPLASLSAPACEALAMLGCRRDPAVIPRLSMKHSAESGTPLAHLPFSKQAVTLSSQLLPSSVPSLHVHMQVEPPET